jgi:hypothetical protein
VRFDCPSLLVYSVMIAKLFLLRIIDPYLDLLCVKCERDKSGIAILTL